MPLEPSTLLAPKAGDSPCGPELRYNATFEELKQLATVGRRTDPERPAERPDWARMQEPILDLCKEAHDLNIWVWLCRVQATTEGLAGLADGLELIATGLERYWESLPPFDPDEVAPHERYMQRLSALTTLGVSNSGVKLDDLLRGGRTVTDFRAELDTIVAKTAPGQPARAALGRCRAAMAAIETLFRERFGPGHDPQLGFELIVGKLKALESKLGGGAVGNGALPEGDPGLGVPRQTGSALGPVTSRDDVVRALNLVLEYYTAHEPSSPVPLLVQRAKRLVSMSFLDAIKELAPAGVKELNAVAGTTDDKK